MVAIHRASRKTSSDPASKWIDGRRVFEDLANYDCKSIKIAEFPAPDGSVELVAEVVTMTKQDYDDILVFLIKLRESPDFNQQLLAGEIYRMLTGKSMWA